MATKFIDFLSDVDNNLSTTQDQDHLIKDFNLFFDGLTENP